MKPAVPPQAPQPFDFSVGKWGNGLAMRLGREAQRVFGLRQGDRLRGQFSTTGDEVTLTLKRAGAPKPRYTLEQLLAGCTRAARPHETWLNPAPQGREVAGASARQLRTRPSAKRPSKPSAAGVTQPRTRK